MLFERTFHPDEANQAFTVGKLLETGNYTYKPTDHHGPTLYYAAAALQKICGHETTADLNGALLRTTPLVFALLSLLFIFLGTYRILKRGGQSPSNNGGQSPSNNGGLSTLKLILVSLIPVALVATNPMFAFYATDFIQEMLLVCFTTMMFWSAAGYFIPGNKWKSGTWALFFGIAAGLAFSTKETSILTFGAIISSSVPFIILIRQTGTVPEKQVQSAERRVQNAMGTIPVRNVILGLMGFGLTAVMFYSSFGNNWHGVYDAFIAAPLSYVSRAVGNGTVSEGADWHIHPWHQYFQWIFANHSNLLPALFWIVLGIPLVINSIIKRNSGKITYVFLGLSLYTFVMIVFYSLIPYKTPWCALQITVPFILAVSFALFSCFEITRDRIISMGVTPRIAKRNSAILFFALFPLLFILQENVPGLIKINKNPDSREIQYNYAHSSPEVKDLAKYVEEAIASAYMQENDTKTNFNGANGKDTKPFVAVALPAEDTWPFPWYNRKHESITGYWNKFDDLIKLQQAGIKPSAVIVPMTQGHLAQALFPHLRETKRFYMRPGVRVRAFRHSEPHPDE